MQPRLSMITLGVRDLETSKRFYRDGYLWEVAHNPFTWIGPPDPEGTEAVR